jgi:hypothetical protein
MELENVTILHDLDVTPRDKEKIDNALIAFPLGIKAERRTCIRVVGVAERVELFPLDLVPGRRLNLDFKGLGNDYQIEAILDYGGNASPSLVMRGNGKEYKLYLGPRGPVKK